MEFFLCFASGIVFDRMGRGIGDCITLGRAQKQKFSFRTMFLIFIMSLEINQVGYIGPAYIMKFLAPQSKWGLSAKELIRVSLELAEQFFAEGRR